MIKQRALDIERNQNKPLSKIITLTLIATAFFVHGPAYGQQGKDALSAITALLLLDDAGSGVPSLLDFPESITYSTTAPIPTLQFNNTGGTTLTSCTVSPPLPAGLSLQISADMKTCEISGTPIGAQSETTFTILAANAQGSDTATVALTFVTGTISLSGTITYDRIPATSTPVALDFASIVQKPARFATIELLDNTNAVLQTSVTDATGQFAFDLTQNGLVKLRVRAELLSTSGAVYDVKVVDNTSSNALYTLAETSASLVTGTGNRNLNAPSGWGGSSYNSIRASAPFAILDSIYEAMGDIIAVDPVVSFPPLVANWSINNAPTSPQNLSSGAIGTSFYGDGNLYILGKENSDTDEFDGHIIVHEWGHYFEDKLSRSDSPGGGHGDNDRLDMRVAFGEGFGNALSGMVFDDPIYIDTSGNNQAEGFVIDVESNTWGNPGWYSEGSVQSILYDLYDNVDDGVDAVTLGLEPIYTVLVNGQKNTAVHTSIFSFISELKDYVPGQAVAISSVVSGQSIVGSTIDDTGSSETNNASDLSNVLPIYTPITAGIANIVNLCTTTAFNNGGDSNKLSNYRYLTFSLASSEYVSVFVEQSGISYGDTDPEFEVVQNGVSKFTGSTADVDREYADGLLSAGDYVLTITDYNIENHNVTAGTACFDVYLDIAP
ncbi:hypothetical protein [Arenicella xantha]|uniref:Uncharacterized protein n=1 Tax=Arenicella xantha TaxID=644221 RepID=A0A395JFG7_9GAMM|nr:hypothetical protein [Arenicella xantha]RBP48543.1 hypothetical protein DFR28_10629 [Arenicella xantha]